MNANYNTFAIQPALPEQQRGVVLFIALIALVAMTLAGIALMRSVDTSTIISGNLAFKQAATSSGDSGLETAVSWISLQSNSVLEAGDATQGYYATSGSKVFTNDATWGATVSVAATGIDINGYGTDSSANTTRYIIERMCNSTGPTSSTTCLFGAETPLDNQRQIEGADLAGANVGSALSPMYRVTARVTGPRNTISYVQAFVY
ncbi:pilus assembly PilX family protein [Sulfurirhabdus autotrophica]|uniref:Tfp pilus assembly protein PilX n=1 Tax=Sulfurirhabdus autotrophica TaxID=1706046 RepID=A0A4R3YAI3_9PROT|nr:hypothetical protein [Sulfurirhabdus autotrophica]TCV88956.1 Tfp pilus assembly protein PilX [Sulfurirhabdus autotrophica]